jgi:ribulose bisphosphate carboxylase small subunit
MQLVQQHATALAPLAPLQSHDELEKLINQSLRGDWIIRVEHIGQDETPQSSWQQWEKALFAVKSSEPVMEAIYACRASNPSHSIRMYAEKVRPQTRFIYPVYDAPVNKPEEVQTVQQVSANAGASQSWGPALAARIRNSGNAMWRYVAVIGVVAGSIMLLEGTAS